MNVRFRDIFVVLAGTIVMNSLVFIVWWSVVFTALTQQSQGDPALAKKIESLKAFSTSSSEFQMNETESQRYLESAAPVFERTDWLAVAAVTSLLTFPLVGFFAARWLESNSWVGLFPILSILGGKNPIVLCTTLAAYGVAGAQLPPPAQVGILALQLVCVYCGGALGYWMMMRRRPPLAAGALAPQENPAEQPFDKDSEP